jgi:hypothetical protein
MKIECCVNCGVHQEPSAADTAEPIPRGISRPWGLGSPHRAQNGQRTRQSVWRAFAAARPLATAPPPGDGREFRGPPRQAGARPRGMASPVRAAHRTAQGGGGLGETHSGPGPLTASGRGLRRSIRSAASCGSVRGWGCPGRPMRSPPPGSARRLGSCGGAGRRSTRRRRLMGGAGGRPGSAATAIKASRSAWRDSSTRGVGSRARPTPARGRCIRRIGGPRTGCVAGRLSGCPRAGGRKSSKRK